MGRTKTRKQVNYRSAKRRGNTTTLREYKNNRKEKMLVVREAWCKKKNADTFWDLYHFGFSRGVPKGFRRAIMILSDTVTGKYETEIIRERMRGRY